MNNVIMKSKGNSVNINLAIPFRDCLYNWRQVSVNDRSERTLRDMLRTAFRNVSNWEIWIILPGWSRDKILWRFDHVPVNFFSQLSF